MSFWKFCEKVQGCGNSIEAITLNIHFVFQQWRAGRTVGEVSDVLQEQKKRQENEAAYLAS